MSVFTLLGAGQNRQSAALLKRLDSSQIFLQAMATATPAQAAPSARSRLAFFDSLELSQTPAGNNGRSPLCVDLSPHMEALNMSLKKQQATPRGSSTLASSTSAPTLLSPSQLFSPEKTAKLNAAAPEFKPPVSMPASPMAGGGKARPMLRVDAPEFVPPVQRSMSVTASPMRGHADAELRAQVQRMAHELEACRRRADIAEKALAASRSNAQARIEPLERELAQMRIVVAAARSSQQREQRNADDLRKVRARCRRRLCPRDIVPLVPVPSSISPAFSRGALTWTPICLCTTAFPSVRSASPG